MAEPDANSTLLNRQTLSDAVIDRLFFAQVREDPMVEIEALNPRACGTYAVVASGGCTALSLLSAGAGHVIAIDLNATQNHLIELKVAALTTLNHDDALRFIGAWKATGRSRKRSYEKLRPQLSLAARQYWDDHRKMISKGILRSGVSERFIGAIMRVVRTVVHSPKTVKDLFLSADLAEQRRFYSERWNNRRWRLLFTVLANRLVFRKTYDPAFFRYVENPSFAKHFYGLAEHSLTEVPIGNNYFLRQMFTGHYGDKDEELPPYLQRSKSSYIASVPSSLTLVDGSFVTYLRSMPDNSVDGFFLSNICEWMDAQLLDDLFSEIVRTAIPNAILDFRNFVGWTEVPDHWKHIVVENKELGDKLIASDRSAMQRRVAVCTITKNAKIKSKK